MMSLEIKGIFAPLDQHTYLILLERTKKMVACQGRAAPVAYVEALYRRALTPNVIAKGEHVVLW